MNPTEIPGWLDQLAEIARAAEARNRRQEKAEADRFLDEQRKRLAASKPKHMRTKPMVADTSENVETTTTSDSEELKEAKARIERVLKMHDGVDDPREDRDKYCAFCGGTFPCDTVKILTGTN